MIIKYKHKNKSSKILKGKKTKERKPKKNKKHGTKKFIITFVSSVLFLIVVFLIYWFLILSSDNYLTKLTILGYDFDFKSDVQSYKLTVSHDTKILNIKTIKSDLDSTVEISDNAYDLDTGDNKVTITVISQNKKKRVYTLEVYRKYLEKSCIEGYELKNDECIKLEYVNDATISYGCNSGGQIENNQCVKYRTKNPNEEYSCSAGYTLLYDACFMTVQTSPKLLYKCPSGYEYKNYTCVSTLTTAPTRYYTCDGRTTTYSSTCTVTENLVARFNGTTYTCDSYDRQYGWSCYKMGSYCHCTHSTSASTLYKCSYGYELDGYICRSTSTTTPTSYYGCDTGYTYKNNSICERTYMEDPTLTYTCDYGYELGSDNVCRKIVSTYEIDTNYSCTDELTLCNDTQCCNRLTSEVIKTEY